MIIKLVVFCFILASLLAAGCSGGDNSKEVDQYLDGFQSQVSNWEAKVTAESVTVDDLQQLTAEGTANAAKITELSKNHKFSEAQGKRAKELGARFQKVTQEIVRKATARVR